MKKIYLDNAAATPIDRRVLREMEKVMSFYANPSSFNDMAREAKIKMDAARKTIAKFLNANPSEIVFTSSGSEANNLAIFGVAAGLENKNKEIITSPIEHLSVLEPIRFFSQRGFKIKFLKVDDRGLIDLDDLRRLLNAKTILVSVMYANNEIGTIEPIKKIAKIIKEFKKKHKTVYPFLHTDACQATEYLDVNINNLGVDLLTLNGSKIYGPRGIGALFIRRGTRVGGLILGGEQELGLRAGTENLPAIVGLAKAVSLINKKKANRITVLRDYFFRNIEKVLPGVGINGPLGSYRLPNNINISVPGLESEKILLELDKYGIYAGSGSACTSHSVEPSHVLKAIRVDRKFLSGALRFSMGRQTTLGDIEFLLRVLPKIVSAL